MNFNKDEFTYHGGFLMYTGDCGKHTRIYGQDEGYMDCHPTRVGTRRAAFVARFKSGGKPQFLNFLIKNFTVEEYFDLAGGIENRGMAPLKILETKGYLSPNAKKAVVAANKDGATYPVTLEGFNQMIHDEAEAYRKERA